MSFTPLAPMPCVKAIPQRREKERISTLMHPSYRQHMTIATQGMGIGRMSNSPQRF